MRSGGSETVCDLVAYALAEEAGETQTGFGFSVGRSPQDLDVDEAANDAVYRATRLLGATKPPSQRLTVVLDPFVTAQFLAIVGSTLSGDAVLKGRSPFGDRVDEVIAAPSVTFVDDPTDVRAFTAGTNDGEGLATRRNVLIDQGRLHRLRPRRLQRPPLRRGLHRLGRALVPAPRPWPAARPSPSCPATARRPSCWPRWATACWWPTWPGCTPA